MEEGINNAFLFLISNPLQTGRVLLTKSLEKEKVENARVEWKKLWRERHDDKVRAEGIAANDYQELFVDKGTIIYANRDFKPLNFKEILKRHQVVNPDRFIPPPVAVGGWGVFIKKNITLANFTVKRNLRATAYKAENGHEKEKQQKKKGGRGWLHV